MTPVVTQITDCDVTTPLAEIRSAVATLREVFWDLEARVKSGEFTPNAANEIRWAAASAECLAEDIAKLAQLHQAP